MVERAASRSSGGSVLVACKLPNGLELQLYDMVDGSEMTPQGSRTVKVARKRGAAIKLNGAVFPFASVPEYAMAGGFSITAVPSDFWEEWKERNKDNDVLANGLVFAASDRAGLDDQIKDIRADNKNHPSVISRMEPLNPKDLKKDPRVRGALAVHGLTVTTAERA